MLPDILDHFTRVEYLENHSYYCDQCKQKVDATKRLLIKSLPNILQLHINRVHWSGPHRQKIHNHVEFPIRGLSMQAYLVQEDLSVEVPAKLVVANGRVRRSKALYSNHSDSSDAKACLDSGFDLHSVVVHRGLHFGSGHYTTYGYDEDKKNWVHCNDVRVSIVPEAEVSEAQAYILFYARRVDNP